MAPTASSIVPYAVIMIIGSPGCRVCTTASSSAPDIAGMRMSESTSA
jgi:hypothetical protein